MMPVIGEISLRNSAAKPVAFSKSTSVVSKNLRYVWKGRNSTVVPESTTRENIVKYKLPSTYMAKHNHMNHFVLSGSKCFIVR